MNTIEFFSQDFEELTFSELLGYFGYTNLSFNKEQYRKEFEKRKQFLEIRKKLKIGSIIEITEPFIREFDWTAGKFIIQQINDNTFLIKKEDKNYITNIGILSSKIIIIEY